MLSQRAFESIKNRIFCIELLPLCEGLPSASIDMILCDLPYGTTACSWDEIIPLEPMWAQFKRVIKPRGAIVLTASQPFTSKLVSSNYEWFRCEWIWEKSQASGFLNANHKPLKSHENILIFADGLTTYNPQITKGKPYRATTGNQLRDTIRDKNIGGFTSINNGSRLPRSVQFFNNEIGLHPTQKPVALFEYLIRTYTQAGEIVLDPCVGSGTTAIAARQTGRQFICGDKDSGYAIAANRRLAKPYTEPMFAA